MEFFGQPERGMGQVLTTPTQHQPQQVCISSLALAMERALCEIPPDSVRKVAPPVSTTELEQLRRFFQAA